MVWVAIERHPDNAKRRKALRDAAGDIKRWMNNNDTVRHHIADGKVTLEGKTVLQVQNGNLAAMADYWLLDDLKNKQWTPVTAPLSR